MSLNVAILMSERVDDPCSVAMGKNICEMGLVESVHVTAVRSKSSCVSRIPAA